MRVAIIGSRSATLSDVIRAVHVFTQKVGVITHVVSGGAGGADSHAAFYATRFQIPVTVHAADWDRYGKAAGYRRNVEIVADCEYVLAIWDGTSKGTEHTMNIARTKGVPVMCVRTTDAAR